VYPPEVEIDLDATYKGAFGREVSWRRTQLDRSSKISLEPELASPSGEGTLAYAVQFVYSPEDTNVLISVGHQGGVAVWTNGKRILQYHGYHRPAVDEGLLGVSKLIRGWNTILMKVESFTGNYDFRLRLLHPDRQPIPGLRFSERLPASPAAE